MEKHFVDMQDYGYLGAAAPDVARVTAVYRQRYELICAQGETFGFLKAASYIDAARPYPTVGDFVQIEYNPSGDSRIIDTLPRRSFFSRRAAGPNAREQAVAANFDYVFIVTSLNGDLNPRRLERYVAIAYDSGATPVVLLTKSDLCADYSGQLRAVQSVAPGISAHAISARTGRGMDALSDYLRPRATLALIGSSGVGKSSLINALAGQALMRVNETRAVDASKGRHTTTHRQLFMLPGGAMVIDTPGMRELGMWSVEAGLSETFEDVESILARGCKFADCRHEREPGCAVLSALKTGELAPERWRSYVALRRESLFAQDRQEALAQKQARGKAIAKYSKSLKSSAKRRGQ